MNKKYDYEINGRLAIGRWMVTFEASPDRARNVVVSGRGKQYHGLSRFAQLKDVEIIVAQFKKYINDTVAESKARYENSKREAIKAFEKEYGEMFKKFAERYTVNVDPDYGDIEFFDNETGISFSGDTYLD